MVTVSSNLVLNVFRVSMRALHEFVSARVCVRWMKAEEAEHLSMARIQLESSGRMARRRLTFMGGTGRQEIMHCVCCMIAE